MRKISAQKSPRPIFTLVVALVALLLPASIQAAMESGDLGIVGWNFANFLTESPEIDFGNDPVVGRMVCPPLSRLNLMVGNSEPLVLSKLELVQAGETVLWRMSLRTGVYWWNGDLLQLEDLKVFIDSQLDGILKKKVAAVYPVPKFSTRITQGKLDILWQIPPKFGPFVLDGVPIWRKKAESSSEKFECVGQYKLLKISDSELALQAAPGYVASRPRVRLFSDPSFRNGGPTIRFKTNPFEENYSKGDSNCTAKVDLPLMTAIVWRSTSFGREGEAMRRLLDAMILRSSITRIAAGGLGSEANQFIPSDYPGNEIKKFAFPGTKTIVAGLARLGYSRLNLDSDLKSKNNEVLSIKLGIVGRQNKIMERILTDGFAAFGVKLETIAWSKESMGERVDGILTTLRLPWPELNFIQDFHSRAINSNSFLDGYNLGVDAALEEYSQSVYQGKPNWSLLHSMVRKIQAAKPVSFIMGHQMCIEASGGFQLKVKPNWLNPDWFRNALLSQW